MDRRMGIGGGRDTIYRSDRAERRIKQTYRSMLDDLGRPVERRWVETRHGVTHVLAAGDADAPPLLVFHGGNAINPITLPWVLPLADEHRLLAPDTIGQPGFSDPNRLSPYESAYAEWVADLLDGFGLERTPMLGFSYGAGIILRVAAYAPDRVDRAALVVPAGLGSASLLDFGVELLWPVVRYRIAPSRANLEAAVQPLFTEPVAAVDDRVIDAIAAVMSGTRIDRRMPPAATADELAGYEAPTLVAAATDDILFPPDVVIPRARSVLHNLEVIMRLEGERHIPKPAAVASLRRYLRAFLE